MNTNTVPFTVNLDTSIIFSFTLFQPCPLNVISSISEEISPEVSLQEYEVPRVKADKAEPQVKSLSSRIQIHISKNKTLEVFAHLSILSIKGNGDRLRRFRLRQRGNFTLYYNLYINELAYRDVIYLPFRYSIC